MDSNTHSSSVKHDTLYHMYTRSDEFIDLTYDQWLDHHPTGVVMVDSVYDPADGFTKHVYNIIDLKKFQHFRLKHSLWP